MLGIWFLGFAIGNYVMMYLYEKKYIQPLKDLVAQIKKRDG